MLPTTRDAEQRLPIRGNVYGVAWHAGAPFEQFGADVEPVSPVLFFKPKNTYLPSGGMVWLPKELPLVEASVVLGLVFGPDARCVPAADAFRHVSGYVMGIDITDAGTGIFRPPIREKCRDGFFPLGSIVLPNENYSTIQDVRAELQVNGMTTGSVDLAGKTQSIAALIHQVSGFMTLRAGDVLLVARMSKASCVSPGSTLSAISETLGRLDCSIAVEEGENP